MSKIAVIIDDLFEDSEYTEPAKAFKGKGHTLVHVGRERGETVKGKKEGTKVTIELILNSKDRGAEYRLHRMAGRLEGL